MDFLKPRKDGLTRAKICGLKCLTDFEVCQKHGADAVGLNFWPSSKRYLSEESIRPWLTQLPDELTRIGVFVNAATDDIHRLLDDGIIHIAQLHGDESPEQCDSLRRHGHLVLKAIGVRDEASLRDLSKFEVDGIVLDAFCPGEYGGSGKTFNWELALAAKEILAETPLILSGGLVTDNVAQAIAKVRPLAVDVASGVESAPGMKCPQKIATFLQAVRSA